MHDVIDARLRFLCSAAQLEDPSNACQGWAYVGCCAIVQHARRLHAQKSATLAGHRSGHCLTTVGISGILDGIDDISSQ